MAKKLKILVIDDEDAVRQIICEYLEHAGHEVTPAKDGEHGLSLINTKDPPQIVITDIIMPRKEGLGTIVEIRKKFPSIKLIAVSGGGRAKTMDFLQVARKLGADAALPKPIDLEELERVIERLA